MSRSFNDHQESSMIPKSNRILVWTGPRATDIIDCENGLFDGSITLYGFEYPEDAKIQNDNEKFDDFFVRLSGKVTTIREDSHGRYYVPNHCFCESRYNLGGTGYNINHNRSDLEEGDLYVLTQQILLMAEKKCDVYFMSYNQNYVGRHGFEDQYLLLASLLVCKRECSTESTSGKKLLGCIEWINNLYDMKTGDIDQKKIKDAYSFLEGIVEEIGQGGPVFNSEGEYDGSNKTKKSQVEIDDEKLLDKRFDSSFFEEFKERYGSKLTDESLNELIDNFCDVLGFVIKVRGFKKGLELINDPKRREYVENILGVWINSLNYEMICKIARLFKALNNKNGHDEGELIRLDKSLSILVEKHIGDGYLKKGKDGNELMVSNINIVWMMKFLSEIIVCHMVCLNRNEYLMKVLDSKDGFRDFCKSHEIPTTENILIKENGENCSLNVFRNYIRCDKFVVQKNHSSGGFGTYLYENPIPYDEDGNSNQDSDPAPITDEIDDRLDKQIINEIIASDLKGCTSGDLIISKYRDPSISLNIHCLISEREILYSPGSVQIIMNTNGRLMYSGADFVAFKQYEKEKPGIIENIMQYISWICGSLRGYGYRGIIGFDIIVSEEYGIEFVEANNRFQASTCLLNKKMRNMMFESGNEGHINRRYDLKPISCNYRFPSMQLLNLLCFKNEDVYSYDGEDENSKDSRSEANGKLIDEYANRFCSECLDKNGSLSKLPVLNSELENMIVPYSMFIFYNSGPFEDNIEESKLDDFKRVTVNGIDHYKMISKCMNEISEDESEEYNREKRKVNNKVVVDVGSFLHNSNNTENVISNPLLNNLELKSHLLNDGITIRYYQTAMKGFRGILGSFIASSSNQDIANKCKDILGSLSALLYSDYSPTCDQICLICDMFQYYQENNGDLLGESIENYSSEQKDHWKEFYKQRVKDLNNLLEKTENNTKITENNSFDYDGFFSELLEIKKKSYEESIPSDILEIREWSIRKFFETMSGFSSSWVEILNKGDIENPVVLEQFNLCLDKILEILYLKEKELTCISYKKIKLLDNNMNSFVQRVIEEEKRRKKDKEKGKVEISNDNLKKSILKELKDTVGFDVKIFSEVYDHIIKNPVRTIELCRVFDGDAKAVREHYDNDAFITKVMFYTNICSTNLGKVVVHPNIMPPDRIWNKRILFKEGADYLALKIGLINNGIRLDKSMKDRFKARPGVNSSVDLIIKCKEYLDYGVLHGKKRKPSSELPINCAYNNSISIFSPYELQTIGDEVEFKTFTIKYYDRVIKIRRGETSPLPLEVGFYHEKDDVTGLTITNKIPKKSIAFLATDRLRLQHNDGCIFASKGRGCKFCEFTVKSPENRVVSFEEEDILEVVKEIMEKHDCYQNGNYVWNTREDGGGTKPKWSFDHVLIGGGTLSNEKHLSRDRITKMAKEILEIEKKRLGEQGLKLEDRPLNIYLMCIPPDDLEDLRAWKDAGITEIAFNMEVYNRQVARRIMPGKSRISRSTYLSALVRAVQIWEEKGAVRSALILGLEKESSTIEGVAMLTSLGVEPILSIFRPVKGTELSYVMPLESPVLYKIYKEAQSLCEQASLRLGPDCIHCQNNTLSLPKELD